MGCYLSRRLAQDGHSNVFRVYNVNSLGNEIHPGKIEVTDSELIWYQKRKEPIRWSLRCLRRYGFDEALFSFESGRRCPTGSGIYAFRCTRAEELFNLVQESIQNVGQQGPIRSSQAMMNGSLSNGRRPNSRPVSMVEMNEPSAIMLSGAGRVAVVPNNQHLYMNESVIPQQEGPNYINTGAHETRSRPDPLDDAAALIDFLHEPPQSQAPPIPGTVNYVDLDLPGSTENLADQCDGATSAVFPHSDSSNLGASNDLDTPEGLTLDDVALNYADLDVFVDNPEDTHPTYINLDSEGSIVPAKKTVNKPDHLRLHIDDGEVTTGVNILPVPVRRPSVDQNYANINAAGSIEPGPITPAAAAPGNGAIGSKSSNPGELNYIEIDVNKTDSEGAASAASFTVSSVPYMVPDSPSKRTESYAMIDMKRTLALSNSAKTVNKNEEGQRKTRHNSTINS